MIKTTHLLYSKRQTGKTEVALDFIVSKIMKSNDKLNICYFAPNKVMNIGVKSRLIKKLIEKGIIYNEKDLLVNNKNLITLKNQINIFFKVDTFDIQTAFRGYNFDYIILDEFSFFNQLRLNEIIDNIYVMNTNMLFMITTPDNKDMKSLEDKLRSTSKIFNKQVYATGEKLNFQNLFLSEKIKKLLSF